MANKAATVAAQSAAATFGNVDLLNTNTNYSTSANKGGTTIFADGDLRTRLWSELVTRDAREKNVFAKFIGSEGSGSPVVEKRDLSAGGSDKVTFTTVAPIRGQGVRGEQILKNKTGKLKFGAFSVEVDLIRHAVAWTQVVKLMRFTGKTIDQLSAEVMSEWAGRTEQDHIQMVLRDTCLNNSTSNLISGYGAGPNLLYTEGLSTDIIQEAKQALIAQGGEPMNVGGDDKTEIPGYLFFAPDACLRPLRSDPDYLEAILQADERSSANKLYSGNYAMWDGNIIANHNVIIDTADGRQGSPLLPTALIGNALTIATAGTLTLGYDCFANFTGFDAKIPGGGGFKYATTATGAANIDGYILAVSPTGDYGCASYKVNTGNQLTGLVRVSSGGQLAAASSAGTPTKNSINLAVAGTIPAGTVIYQCNSLGTPIGYALAMGKSALYYAKGAVSNEQIFHYDDFANSGNEAHLSAVGIQSVYGMAAYQDTNGRIPGAQLVEAVRQIPGFSY